MPFKVCAKYVFACVQFFFPGCKEDDSFQILNFFMTKKLLKHIIVGCCLAAL